MEFADILNECSKQLKKCTSDFKAWFKEPAYGDPADELTIIGNIDGRKEAYEYAYSQLTIAELQKNTGEMEYALDLLTIFVDTKKTALMLLPSEITAYNVYFKAKTESAIETAESIIEMCKHIETNIDEAAFEEAQKMFDYATWRIDQLGYLDPSNRMENGKKIAECIHDLYSRIGQFCPDATSKLAPSRSSADPADFILRDEIATLEHKTSFSKVISPDTYKTDLEVLTNRLVNAVYFLNTGCSIDVASQIRDGINGL
jgi:flagellin-specific chaperone FliS